MATKQPNVAEKSMPATPKKAKGRARRPTYHKCDSKKVLCFYLAWENNIPTTLPESHYEHDRRCKNEEKKSARGNETQDEGEFDHQRLYKY